MFLRAFRAIVVLEYVYAAVCAMCCLRINGEGNWLLKYVPCADSLGARCSIGEVA